MKNKSKTKILKFQICWYYSNLFRRFRFYSMVFYPAIIGSSVIFFVTNKIAVMFAHSVTVMVNWFLNLIISFGNSAYKFIYLIVDWNIYTKWKFLYIWFSWEIDHFTNNFFYVTQWSDVRFNVSCEARHFLVSAKWIPFL